MEKQSSEILSKKEKLNWLLNKYPLLLKELDANAQHQWGKMNVQQMIEHMTDSVMEANGKIPRIIVTSPEKIQPSRDFLMSEKEFRPNTKNVLMGEEPLPTRTASKESAVEVLVNELINFEKVYSANPQKTITNPFFGDLDHEEWVQLLHKHAVHHLKQFGVSEI